MPRIIALAGGGTVYSAAFFRGQPIWREGFVTDNGNHILDVHDLQISNPLEMEARVNGTNEPVVVER